MSMRTPLSRARGLGAAREGARHFWWQRLTAVANIPLALAFVVVVINLVGADYEAARELVARPPVAVLILLLILSATYHMRIGMQAIIEDYVAGDGLRIVALAANTLFAILIAVACGFAVLRISLGD